MRERKVMWAVRGDVEKVALHNFRQIFHFLILNETCCTHLLDKHTLGDQKCDNRSRLMGHTNSCSTFPQSTRHISGLLTIALCWGARAHDYELKHFYQEVSIQLLFKEPIAHEAYSNGKKERQKLCNERNLFRDDIGKLCRAMNAASERHTIDGMFRNRSPAKDRQPAKLLIKS